MNSKDQKTLNWTLYNHECETNGDSDKNDSPEVYLHFFTIINTIISSQISIDIKIFLGIMYLDVDKLLVDIVFIYNMDKATDKLCHIS